jgi:hemolysin activation/secretion protein
MTIAGINQIALLGAAFSAIAQSLPPPELTNPSHFPRNFSVSETLPVEFPESPPTPTHSNCLFPTTDTSDRFSIKTIKVEGNTVLQSEITALIKPFENQEVTLESLLCLRSQMTELYLKNGYLTSGAFLPNNQNLSSGTVTIQVVEGKLERLDITGLERLQENYIRSRIELGTGTPFNQNQLEETLKLLQLDPLIEQVNAELTAGSSPGQSILLVTVKEAPAFHTAIGFDNYRPPSIGSEEGSLLIAHDNLLGFGDRFLGEVWLTEGLTLYDLSYAIPLNPHDGTLKWRYWRSDNGITEDIFRDFNIRNENENFSLSFRQPLLRSPQEELALGLELNLRRSQSSLLGEPFCFSPPCSAGTTNLTILRFSQEWVNRAPEQVLAARSQLSFGLAAFDATTSKIEPDAQFWSWLGQFQWVQQLSPRVLLVARFDAQLTPDALPIIEQFSLGGIDTVRGYIQNQLVTDNGLLGALELRIPLTSDPNVLQLRPFVEVGTGWNNLLPNPNPSTLAGIGLGIRWQIVSGLNFQFDYGIPLIAVDNAGNSLQAQGLYFSLRYQPF